MIRFSVVSELRFINGPKRIENGLEGQNRGNVFERGIVRQAHDLILQRLRQAVALAAAVDRKRVVFERVEFGHDAQPRRLGKGRQHSGQPGETGQPGKAGDANHR